MPEIEYRIESADTDRREFHIAIHFTPRKENYPITLRMPAWTPGSYLLREYAGSISDIEAYQGETPLNVIKSDKATFVLANTSGDRTPVTIRYALTAEKPGSALTALSFPVPQPSCRFQAKKTRPAGSRFLPPPGIRFPLRFLRSSTTESPSCSARRTMTI